MKKISKEDIYIKILSGELCTKDDWDDLCWDNELSTDILNEFANKINWNYIMKFQSIPIKCFIRNHNFIINFDQNDNMYYNFIITHKLSKYFIKKYIFPYIGEEQKKLIERYYKKTRYGKNK